MPLKCNESKVCGGGGQKIEKVLKNVTAASYGPSSCTKYVVSDPTLFTIEQPNGPADGSLNKAFSMTYRLFLQQEQAAAGNDGRRQKKLSSCVFLSSQDN